MLFRELSAAYNVTHMGPVDLKSDGAVAPSPLATDTAAHKRTVRIAQALVIAILLTTPVVMCLRNFNMGDNDVWWHLRTGEWIAIHHAVPEIEPFSRPVAGQPWIAYSWAFELLLYRLFLSSGLAGFAIYTVAMVLLTCVALYWMIQRQGLELPPAAIIAFAGMYSMAHLYTPRPWLFTVFLFVCELGIIMHARRTGKTHHLIWLPLIFAIWANVHIQFIDGLCILALALAEAVSARWWSGAQKTLAAPPLATAFAASIVATFANPYGWRIYRVAHDLATQAGVMDKINELKALPFRDPAAYVVLLLALASAAILGYQRKVLSFEGALLAFAAVLSFRSQRDVWLIAAVAAAIIAPAIPKARKAVEVPTAGVVAAAFGIAIMFSAAACRLLGLNNASLKSGLEQQMPARATDYILAHEYPGPIFNDFNWGGYLIWKLRMPVSLDGRAALYGDTAIDRSVATWSGAPDWAADPLLASARLVIAPVQGPLTQLLRRDSQYQMVYEDKLAAVFTRR